jgi:zinc transport system substrate-binding protein
MQRFSGKVFTAIFGALLALFFFGADTAQARMKVFVSIAPQKYFVERIGAGLVDVSVLVAPGASPHTYEPKPRQMAALAEADLLFAVGVPFEAVWLPRISAAAPGLKIVSMEEGIRKIPMSQHSHDDGHDDGHDDEQVQGPGHDNGDDEHNHGVLDPHVWLSPKRAFALAQNTAAALSEIDPHHRVVYQRNLEALLADIQKLDETLEALFAEAGAIRTFMVYHPAWGYLAHDYGLVQIPVEISGKDPKPAQLQKLIETAREKDIRILFVQPQFSQKSAQVVAKAINGRVETADPLDENWMDSLLFQARSIAEAVR